jgi:hypothetical protein
MPKEMWAPLNLAKVTATPSDAQESSIWYRTDLDQVHGSDGGSGLPLMLGPVGNLPVIRSTAWHTVPPFGPVGSANFPADRLFALPFWPGRACTLTAMAANVTLALVGGNIRMGLYASDGSVPTTLVADYGTVTVGLTGVRQITGLSTAVRPVLHYAVIARQGGVLNLGLTSRDTWDPIVSESSPTLAGNLNAYYRDTVSGALPANFGAIAGTINSPALTIQLT